MKKWSLAALLPGFLTLNSQAVASSTGLPNSELTFEPEDLVFAPLNTETPFYIAGHRSHSSHRSHRSHSSHRSSSGEDIIEVPLLHKVILNHKQPIEQLLIYLIMIFHKQLRILMLIRNKKSA